MIKMAPTLIEFGDGDTGYKMGITDDDYGLVTLYNTEPGEIGRPGEEEPPVERIGAYILFKNVKSLDCIIEGLTKMRDAMVEEGTDENPTNTDTHVDAITVDDANAESRPLKNMDTCETCRWGYINECRHNDCEQCPNHTGVAHTCKCGNVLYNQPCPYFEKWEEPSDE